MPSSNYKYQKIRYMTYDEMLKLSKTELVEYINLAANYAEKRRDKMNRYFSENPNLPTPASYRETDITKKNKISKTRKEKLKEKDFTGWANYDFRLKNEAIRNIKNVDKRTLAAKLKTTQQFLKNKTSTVYGMKKLLNDFSNRMKQNGLDVSQIKSVTEDNEKYKMLWRIYNEVGKEYNYNLKETLTSRDAQKRIVQLISANKSEEQIVKKIKDIINKKYGSVKYKEKKRDIKENIIDRASSFEKVDDYATNSFESDKL